MKLPDTEFNVVPLPRGANTMEERYKYSIDESIMIERDIPWDKMAEKGLYIVIS